MKTKIIRICKLYLAGGGCVSGGKKFSCDKCEFSPVASPLFHEALADLVAQLEAKPIICGHTEHCTCPMDRARAVLAKLEGS